LKTMLEPWSGMASRAWLSYNGYAAQHLTNRAHVDRQGNRWVRD